MNRTFSTSPPLHVPQELVLFFLSCGIVRAVVKLHDIPYVKDMSLYYLKTEEVVKITLLHNLACLPHSSTCLAPATVNFPLSSR